MGRMAVMKRRNGMNELYKENVFDGRSHQSVCVGEARER